MRTAKAVGSVVTSVAKDNPDALVKIGSVPSWIVSVVLLLISVHMGHTFERLQVRCSHGTEGGGYVMRLAGNTRCAHACMPWPNLLHTRQRSGEVIGQLEEMQAEGLVPPALEKATGSSVSSSFAGGGVQGEDGEAALIAGDELELAALQPEVKMRVSVRLVDDNGYGREEGCELSCAHA